MLKNPYSNIFIDDQLGPLALERYRRRRRELVKTVGHLIVISGVMQAPSGVNKWALLDVPVYQDPLLLYLTGINQPGVILLLDPTNPDEEILFLDSRNRDMEFWEGVHFGVGDSESEELVRSVTGIQSVRHIRNFQTVIKDLLTRNEAQPLGMFWHENQAHTKRTRDYHYDLLQKMKRFLKQAHLPNLIVNIASVQWEFRFRLDDQDIKNARIANEKTTAAFTAVLTDRSLFSSEMTVAGALVGELRKQSPYGVSFPSIVAGGQNACVLHYNKNDDPFEGDELLLLDFGVRWGNMHADVSRTIPVNGRFNPLQALLYQIVYDAQAVVEKAVRPGITIRQLNEHCWAFIEHALQTRFRDKGGIAMVPYKGQPHNVSHLIGLQVHEGDSFREYRDLPLKSGWMISNEPGLYGYFEWQIEGKTYAQHIGIRLEDDLLVTNAGCLNLTTCPKSMAEIEALSGISQGDLTAVTAT